MAQRENFYEKFKINSNATTAELQKAYRTLVRKYHPDIYKGQNAELKTKKVNEIYEVLSDPVKRAEHDAAIGLKPGQIYVYVPKSRAAKGTATGKTGNKPAAKKPSSAAGTVKKTPSAKTASVKTTGVPKTAYTKTSAFEADEQSEIERCLAELAILNQQIEQATEEKRESLEKQIAELDAIILRIRAAKKARDKAAKEKAAAEKEASGDAAEIKKTTEKIPAAKKPGGSAKAKTAATGTAKKTPLKTDSAKKSTPAKKTPEVKNKDAEIPASIEINLTDTEDDGLEAAPLTATAAVTDDFTEPAPKMRAPDFVASVFSTTKEFDDFNVGLKNKESESPSLAAQPIAGKEKNKRASKGKIAAILLSVLLILSLAFAGLNVYVGVSKNYGFMGGMFGYLEPAQGITSQPVTYTLTYLSDSNGYILGEEVQEVEEDADGSIVVAMPVNGEYIFDEWSDGVKTPHRTDTGINGHKTVTAMFKPVDPLAQVYTLAYTAGANGFIEGNINQAVEDKFDGTTVTAVPYTGYYFVRWSDGIDTASRTDKNITGNINVTAEFKEYTSYVYAALQGGALTGEAAQNLKEDEAAYITVAADAGYYFDGWSDGLITESRTDGYRQGGGQFTFTAVFKPCVSLSYSAGTGGTVTGTLSQDGLKQGVSGEKVTAVADAGYYFDVWSDGVMTESRTDITGTADFSVTAEFKRYTAYVYTAAVGGAITGGLSTQRIKEGGTAFITAVANKGYYMSGWDDGVMTESRTDGYKQGGGQFDKIAVFKPYTKIKYTVSDGDAGEILGNANQRLKEGEDGAPVFAAPKDGYYFEGWFAVDGYEDGVSVPLSSGLAHTWLAGESETGILAVFKKAVKFVITSEALTGGSLIGSVEQYIRQGETPKITALSYSGYTFAYWIINGEPDYSGGEEFSFNALSGEYEVSAVFIEGLGTATLPFKVASYETLLSVNRLGTGAVKRYFVQTGDIDLSAVSGFEPLCKDGFTGDYAGGDKEIIDLWLNIDDQTGDAVYAGLFAKIKFAAVVSSLWIVNMHITARGTGTVYAGALAGEITGEATVQSVYVLLDGLKPSAPSNCGIDASSDGSAYIGGVTGRAEGTNYTTTASVKIVNCTVRGIYVVGSGTQGGQSFAGGIVGYGTGVTLNDSNNHTVMGCHIIGGEETTAVIAGWLENTFVSTNSTNALLIDKNTTDNSEGTGEPLTKIHNTL